MNIHSKEQMREFGTTLAQSLKAGDVIYLKGQLGVGKSELARAIIRALTQDPNLETPSPSFTLIQSYQAQMPIYHLDLYRLGSVDELIELGIPEIFEDGISLVEWPERLGQYSPRQIIEIEILDKGAEVRELIIQDGRKN